MSFDQLFGDSSEIKEQLEKFAASMVDTCVVLHSNPRLLHTQANLGMSFFNQNDYLDMFYALDDSIPGNEYKWHERNNFKITFEFAGDWVPCIINLPYKPEDMPILRKYIEEKQFDVVAPEFENKNQTGIIGSQKGHFIVNGLFLYDVEMVKEFMTILDQQFHNFFWEEQ